MRRAAGFVVLVASAYWWAVFLAMHVRSRSLLPFAWMIGAALHGIRSPND
jgi:hypothetical protein